MLKKYNQFKEDFLLESINESVIYFSPNFRKLLSKIEDNDIAKDLLEVEVTDIKPDVTFIDLDPEKDDYLSFTTMRNAIKVIDDGYSHLKEIENEPTDTDAFSNKESRISLINQMYSHNRLSDIFKKSRNPLRIGKFVNKVLGTTKYNSTQVEEFVNKLRASKEQSGERFLIVEGDDIAFWYKSENYAEIKGHLGNSCMREKPSSFFEIYVKNPEVCRMLVLLEDDKLIGRALIWKLSYAKSYGKNIEDGIYFMDRQYTTKDSDVDKFRSYAVENGWAYKSNNNHHSLETITYNDETFNCTMSVNIKDLSYDRYPYMDTFRRYSSSSHTLFNDEEDSSDYEGDYILDHTDGTYREIEGGVWSNWHDRMIPEDSAVWSDWADSYLDSENAIRVEDGSRRNHGWYPEDCDDIVYDEWNEVYLNVDDSVYSDNYGYSIEASTAVEVIDDIDESDGEPRGYDSNWYHEDDKDLIYLGGDIQKMAWFKRLSEKWGAWDDYSYAIGTLFTKNYQDKWILSAYKISVYPVAYIDNDEIEYLSKLDAKTLGYSIEESNVTIMDKFEYHESIEDILPKLKSELDSKLKSINDTIEGRGQLTIPFEDDKEYRKRLTQRASSIEERISEIEDGLFIDD
jgi:DNA-binding LytR/AlgR family response regulator